MGAVVEGWGGREVCLPAQNNRRPALPLRGRSRTDTSPVRPPQSGSIENPVVIFAWDPGKIQTKALHHVLRTAGTLPIINLGPYGMRWGATSGGRLKVKGKAEARLCRPLATRVQRGSASTHHLRKIAALFAQQPRPNDKRNPLLHVLRTAGTGGRLREGPEGRRGRRVLWERKGGFRKRG